MCSIFIDTIYAFISYAVPSSSVNALSSHAKEHNSIFYELPCCCDVNGWTTRSESPKTPNWKDNEAEARLKAKQSANQTNCQTLENIVRRTRRIHTVNGAGQITISHSTTTYHKQAIPILNSRFQSRINPSSEISLSSDDRSNSIASSRPPPSILLLEKRKESIDEPSPIVSARFPPTNFPVEQRNLLNSKGPWSRLAKLSTQDLTSTSPEQTSHIVSARFKPWNANSSVVSELNNHGQAKKMDEWPTKIAFVEPHEDPPEKNELQEAIQLSIASLRQFTQEILAKQEGFNSDNEDFVLQVEDREFFS
jgi:hypothetical protein